VKLDKQLLILLNIDRTLGQEALDALKAAAGA